MDTVCKPHFSLSLPKIIIAMMILGIVGPWQIVLIVLVVVLLFGGRKIPELMKGLGKGVSSFKEGINEGMPDDEEEKKEDKKK